MKVKYIIILFFLWINVNADVCNQTLVFNENNKMQTTIQYRMFKETKNIDKNLYIRYFEKKGQKYGIFWFGNAKTKKDDIDINTKDAPFIVKYKDLNRSFSIEKIEMLSKDNYLKKYFFDTIEVLQFGKNNGQQKFKIFSGQVEVEQEVVKNKYYINRFKRFTNGLEDKNIKYDYSEVAIALKDKSCKIWDNISLHEIINFKSHMMDIKVKNDKKLKVVDSTTKLPANHWFLKLSGDISKWKFRKKVNPMQFKDAQTVYETKESQMKSLLGDTKKFGTWVKANMDFLMHLDKLLENNTLDNNVSMNLFAKLGYLDTIDTTEILSRVSLNENVPERDRFRGLMSLKDSSAPIDDVTLNEIIDYGFAQEQETSMIQSAMGMITGALAKKRKERVPEQYNQIVSSITSNIYSKENKNVALAAAGNLLETANSDIIEAIDSSLVDKNHLNRKYAADELVRIKKSHLSTDNFSNLIKKEKDSRTKSSLIEASATATDFKQQTQFNTTLLEIVKNRGNDDKNRIAAINTLTKSGYGNIRSEKKIIRQLMIGEDNNNVNKALKKLYRK